MSLGYLGYAEKVDEDENTVIYSYGSVNWNDEKYKNDERIKDGVITINKNGLPEIVVEKKIKRLPNGGKAQFVKNKLDVDCFELVKNKTIIIENTMNCWNKNQDGVDVIAMSLCLGLMDSYKEKSVFPKNIGTFK